MDANFNPFVTKVANLATLPVNTVSFLTIHSVAPSEDLTKLVLTVTKDDSKTEIPVSLSVKTPTSFEINVQPLVAKMDLDPELPLLTAFTKKLPFKTRVLVTENVSISKTGSVLSFKNYIWKDEVIDAKLLLDQQVTPKCAATTEAPATSEPKTKKK